MPCLLLFAEIGGIHVDTGAEARTCRLTVAGKWPDAKRIECTSLLPSRPTEVREVASPLSCVPSITVIYVQTHSKPMNGRCKSDQRSIVL
jgi:hypothetical protein